LLFVFRKFVPIKFTGPSPFGPAPDADVGIGMMVASTSMVTATAMASATESATETDVDVGAAVSPIPATTSPPDDFLLWSATVVGDPTPAHGIDALPAPPPTAEAAAGSPEGPVAQGPDEPPGTTVSDDWSPPR